MTRTTSFRPFLIEIALGISAAAALAFLPQTVFAQRGAAGGMRTGGSSHKSSGSRATGSPSSAARQSGSSHSVQNTVAAPQTAGTSSHNVANVASTGGASPRPALSSSVSVLSSSGMPAGLAKFAEPAQAGRGPASSSSAPNPPNRNVTIGFPPTGVGGWVPAAVRGGMMNLSGQGRQTWQDSQSRLRSIIPNRSGPASSMQFGGPGSPRVFPPWRFHPRFPIFGQGFGFFGPFGPFGRFGTGCGFFGGCGFASFGNYYSAGGAQSGMQDDTSREYGPFDWQNPPASPDSTGPSNFQSGISAAPPDTLIFLKDGTSYAVTDYWLADYKLHYITSYGGQNSLDLNQLDLQRTVDDNASRGVDFTLRPVSTSAPPQ